MHLMSSSDNLNSVPITGIIYSHIGIFSIAQQGLEQCRVKWKQLYNVWQLKEKSQCLCPQQVCALSCEPLQ